MTLVVRLVLIGVGYTLASLAAGLVFVVLAMALAGVALGEFAAVGALRDKVLAQARGVAVAFAAIFALPALAGIIYCEAAGYRNVIGHALFGAAVALAAALLMSHLFPAEKLPTSVRAMAAFTAAGAAAGLIYWLVAGRSAGRSLVERVQI